MNWVFDHFQLIIAIAGGIAWWLKQRKEAQETEAAPPREEATFDDPELAERTRRIREEIQRRIAERAKGYRTEQPKPMRPEPDVPPPIIREVAVTPASPPRRVAAETQRQAEILEQQAALAEKMRELELMKTAAQKRTEFETATADQAAAVRTRTRATVVDDLRSPDALRRAFILREVLGPPLALRR